MNVEFWDSVMEVCSYTDLQGYILSWLWLISDSYRNDWVVIMGNIKQWDTKYCEGWSIPLRSFRDNVSSIPQYFPIIPKLSLLTGFFLLVFKFPQITWKGKNPPSCLHVFKLPSHPPSPLHNWLNKFFTNVIINIFITHQPIKSRLRSHKPTLCQSYQRTTYWKIQWTLFSSQSHQSICDLTTSFSKTF